MLKERAYCLLLIALCIMTPFLKCKRVSSYPFISGDTFRAIADHIVDETNKNIDTKKINDGDIIFLKTDYIPYFFTKIHPNITQRYILITHNSAFSPIYLVAQSCPQIGVSFETYLDDPHLIVWFAQNIDYDHPKLKPLPLGIANSYWKHGDTTIISRVIRVSRPFTQKLSNMYVNFKLATNTTERKKAFKQCKTLSLSRFASRKRFAAYLKEMELYRYVISPPGNGLDCHRTWEALLIGCIPIVKYSRLDPLFEKLPVIFVHEWSEMTEDFLEQEYQKLIHKKFNYEKIYADYWIKKIKSYREIEENTYP